MQSPPTQQRQRQPTGSWNDAILLDDDDDDDEVNEVDGGDDDDEVQMTGSRSLGAGAGRHSVEDDEAMARRLQEEMYGSGGGGGGGGGRLGEELDENGVRAPIARTTETLVGPGSDWRGAGSDDMNAAIMEQLSNRNRAARRAAQQSGGGPAGIFNQRGGPSIWSDDHNGDPVEARRRALAASTGGASEQTSKATLLADLFRPPFDLICPLPWSEARDEGKETEKWIIVNVQDPSIFDCQVLNRDIWKNPSVRETLQAHFLFLQYSKADPRGQEYMQYYFAAEREREASYPHIAIVDPRTGEQVKVWSGSPAPKAEEFLMELHEFLDRYSLSVQSKNPVQGKRKEKKKAVDRMSEEEMMELALRESMGGGAATTDDANDDPDALTRSTNGLTNGTSKAASSHDTTSLLPTTTNTSNGHAEPTPFDLIPSTHPHTEPDASVPAALTTRIQFRHPNGRVVRKFLLADPVQALYEWLKAEPLEGQQGKAFELVALGRNLMGRLGESVEGAGLRNASVMVEFVDAE